MQIFVYLIVLMISAGSILFGAEWLQAPMSPMPTSPYELHAAKTPAAPPVQEVAGKPAEAKPTEAMKPVVAQGQPSAQSVQAGKTGRFGGAAPTPALESAPTAADTSLVAPEPSAAIASTGSAPLCDVVACGRAYRSFTASDCTYQPSDGPRRLCTRGTPPAAGLPRQDIRAQATCNIAACTSAYQSFSAVDCTYQPVEGPRRVCEK